MASNFKHPGLQSMGYYFNNDLELRQIESNEEFKWQGQQHYDVLGDFVTEWIQDYMVSHYEMKEIWLGDEYPKSEEEPNGEAKGSEKGEGEEGNGKEGAKEPLKWEKPSRSGVFTIQAEDLERVQSSEMKRHAKCNIFISSNFYEAEKLLILVQGSGAVRPGQWARALCINNSLKAGTIFDYLDIAKECGMAVIVLNPNQGTLKLRVKSEEKPLGDFDPNHSYPILGHEDHVKHILYVYDNFVRQSPAKDMWMVAHSRGGDSALQLLNHRLGANLIDSKATRSHIRASSTTGNPKIESKVTTIEDDDGSDLEEGSTDLERRLRAIAFTDSVHWIGSATSTQVTEWVRDNARDWVASKNPLDHPEPSHLDSVGCYSFSSGHFKHEWTSPCAVNSVFKFFESEFATRGSFPVWTPRRIPFSTPPQNMEAEPEPVMEAGGSPSYAAVARVGRNSVKLDGSPRNESKLDTAPLEDSTGDAADRNDFPSTAVEDTHDDGAQPPAQHAQPAQPEPAHPAQPPAQLAQSPAQPAQSPAQPARSPAQPAQSPAQPAQSPAQPIEPARVNNQPTQPRAKAPEPESEKVPNPKTPTPSTSSSSTPFLSSNTAFLVGFAAVAACAIGAGLLLVRRSRVNRK